MAGPLRGIDGVFEASLDGGVTYSEVGYTEAFNLSFSIDTEEIPKLNATAKEFMRGLSGGTLSANGTLIWDDVNQRAMINQFLIVDDNGAIAPVSTAALRFQGVLQVGDPANLNPELRNTVKIIAQIQPTGLTLETQASGSPRWSYDGQVDGDAVFSIETET